MKTIIVTASDEKFSSLFLGLISSLQQFQPGLCDAIGVLDLGLAESTLGKIRESVTHIVIPEWDFAIDPTLQNTAPHLRGLLARPFLPKYFPGYDMYLWLDADMWLQENYAVNWFFQAAATGAMAIVPEVHQSYVLTEDATLWRKKGLYEYFGAQALALCDQHNTYNAGAFALQATSPHWNTWARYFGKGLRAAPHKVSDQTALNYAIWSGDIKIHPLPAVCNWCCHFAFPVINIDIKRFCEPHIPNRPIGIMHLTAGSKDSVFTAIHEGKTNEIGLRFGELATLA